MGTMYAQVSPANIAARDDTDPGFKIAGKYYDPTNDRVVMYVKFDNGAGNIAAANGALAYWKTYNTTVTSDNSDALGANATTDRNFVCGVFLNAITDAKYGFIQVGGRHATVKTNGDDDIVAGDIIIASTGDGTADSVAAGTAPTFRVVGIALAADVDADDTVDTLITLDHVA